jgi:transcriptional regulator with PAS, ATPase and Fis domain
MSRKVVKKTLLQTTVKTVEIDGKKYIEYSSGNTMQDYQNAIINNALKENNFQASIAANSLNIGKSTVYRLMSLDLGNEQNKKDQ